jgi:hypothetical protein
VSATAYLNFDLLIESAGAEYRASVVDSPVGEESHTFALPFSEKDLKLLVYQVMNLSTRRSVRAIASPEMRDLRSFGGTLFESVFSGPVGTCLLRSMDEADRTKAGLRVRLHLGEAPTLANIPWEFLYDASSDDFLCLSDQTPIVRYLDLPQRVEPLSASPPLRMLCLISSPAGYPPLNVEHEWEKLSEALAPTIAQGRLVLERVDTPSLEALQRRLRRDAFHVLHFIGHGAFDEQAQDGVLLFEDLDGKGRPVAGEALGVLLHDHESMRLVVLNACEGARTSSTDPFAGTAQSLVRKGIPAVIAMQFEISDQAAITLAGEFYSAVADGYPVDASVAEARKAIFTRVNAVEWATPVLYMRSPDGRIFEIEDHADREDARGRQPAEPGPVHSEGRGAPVAVVEAVPPEPATQPVVVEPEPERAPVAVGVVTEPVPPPSRVEPTAPGRPDKGERARGPSRQELWRQRRVIIPVAIMAAIAVIVALVTLTNRGSQPTGASSPTSGTSPSGPPPRSPSSNSAFPTLSFVPAANIEHSGSGEMLRVMQGGSAFSAVGSDASKAIVWLSSDASSWLRQELPQATEPVRSAQAQGIVEFSTSLVAAGYERSASDKPYAVVWTFSGGNLSWEAHAIGSEDSLVNRVSVVAGKAVAVGRVGQDAGLWSSTDGMTWSRNRSAVFRAVGGGTLVLRDVFEGTNHAVAVGQNSASGAAAWYFTRPNGPWTRANVLGAGPGQGLVSVTGGTDRFVAVGYAAAAQGDDAAVWTSVNGVTWERAPAKGLHRTGVQRMRGVAYVPGVGFVAVGVDGSDAAVWTSRNGLDWARVPAPLAEPGEREMTGILASGNQLIVVGKDNRQPAGWVVELKSS